MSSPFDFDDPGRRERVRLALEAFLAAVDEDEMAQVVADYSFVAESRFADGVDQLIDHASRVGDADALFRLQGQLELLQSVLAMQGESAGERALHAFLYAADEDEAADVFAREATLLKSAEVRAALFALEAGDPESDLHLEVRRALWQRLVRST
ncbi:MAG: hypothetical protein R2873_26520 [Caldilineaceae bacterium]